MTTIEKYNNVFCDVLNITEDKLPGLTYQSIREWDSVGHMGLIAGLESAFDIMLDTEDILNFNSYERGKEILEKYDVRF